MAKRAGAVGFNRPLGKPEGTSVKRRNAGSGRLSAWLGAPRAEAFRPPDVTDPRRAITRLERRNRDTQHNNDMYQIGGGPITVKSHLQGGIPPERLAMAETRYPKGRVEIKRGPSTTRPARTKTDGTVVPAKVIPGKVLPGPSRGDWAAAGNKPGFRAHGSGHLIPFGKPPEPTLGRGPNGRMRPNPAYRDYKNIHKLNPQVQGTLYNNAVSRQFGDAPPVGITPSSVAESPSAPARTRYGYRSGKQQTDMKPKPNPSPIDQRL